MWVGYKEIGPREHATSRYRDAILQFLFTHVLEPDQAGGKDNESVGSCHEFSFFPDNFPLGPSHCNLVWFVGIIIEVGRCC